MPPGAITQYIDVPQVAFWTFFLAFLGLVYYLRREDKREGYPLVDQGQTQREGFPLPPPPRTLLRMDGTTTEMPHDFPNPPMSGRPSRFAGDPTTPIGNHLTSAIGPGTYVMRRDEPFRTHEGRAQVQPMRVATDWRVAAGDADPRGMRVLDAHFKPVGVVRDLWVDRGVKILRYLEIELDGAGGPQPLLVPLHHCAIDESDREVRVTALRDNQFTTVPQLNSPDQITAREEDKLNGFYAGGHFYLEDFTPEVPQ